MSKKTDTWMPLLVDKYLGDTGHLNTEQHGAYLLMLMQAWKKGGLLPNDDSKLATICRLPPAKWRAYKDTLLEFFTPTADGKAFTQKRLSEELARAQTTTEKKAQAGAKGAAKRWRGDGSATGDANGTAMAQPLADPSQTHWQTGTPTPTHIASPTENPPVVPPQGGDDGLGPGDAGDPAEGGDGDPPPATATLPPGTAGAFCRALREAGISRVSMDNPDLHALIAVGATVAELVALVPDALKADDPFTYLLATAKRKRIRAARDMTAMHRGPMPTAPPPDDRKSRQLSMAAALTGADRHTSPSQPQSAEVVDVESRVLPS